VAEQTANWNGWNPAGASGHAPGEWPALYAQYLLRAAGQSTRASELYQRVLDSVARGELAPTVFKDLAPGFIQARGPDYSLRLAQVSARFFAGMVELDTAATRELSGLMAAAGEQPGAAPPPAYDAADPAQWYQALSDYAAQQGAQATAAYKTLLERVAAGEVAPGQVQVAASDYLQRRLPEHLNGLGTLYFDLLSALNDLRAAYEEEFLTGVLAGARRPGQEAPPALNLTAPLGTTTSASLSLTNTRAEPAVIHCALTDVRRADGVGPAFAPHVTIAPPGLTIPPGGQADLTLSLRLDAGQYTPAALYVGAVHIARAGEPRLEIPLRITASPPPPPPAEPAAPVRTRAAAKKTGAKRQTAKRKA
jgi:hypothetical protein